MTRHQRIYVAVIVVGGSIGGACLVLRPGHTAFAETATTEPADSDKPVAKVQTTPLRIGEITRTLTAYGSVVAAPGGMTSLTAPLESRVVHLLISAGQSVEKGAAILELESSPDSKLQMLDARNGLEAAKKNLADTQQRFDMKLATNADLLQLQQAVQTAQLKFDDLQKRGAGDDTRKITAEADGVVSKIDVTEGQIVAAGGSLVELLGRWKVEISIGVEPSDAGTLSVDQPIQIFPSASTTGRITGKIRLVTQHINPATRLVDVFITPDSKDHLLLDDFVRGEIKIQTQHAMIVPASAILADDDGLSIFIIRDSKAVKKVVKVAVQNEKEAAINGEDLHEGDTVIAQSGLELEDGMAVAVEAGK